MSLFQPTNQWSSLKYSQKWPCQVSIPAFSLRFPSSTSNPLCIYFEPSHQSARCHTPLCFQAISSDKLCYDQLEYTSLGCDDQPEWYSKFCFKVKVLKAHGSKQVFSPFSLQKLHKQAIFVYSGLINLLNLPFPQHFVNERDYLKEK